MDPASESTQKSTTRRVRPTLDAADRERVLRAVCRRVTAAVRREPADSTRATLASVGESPVYGAFVTLRRKGRLRACCGHIDESGLLWQALDSAANRAATDDPRFPPITDDELSEIDVDVWVLWGPQLVMARGDDRVRAIVIGKHGVQISRGGARGLLLPGVAIDHDLDARAFLEQVCIKAGLPVDAWKDDATKLRVFEGEAIHGRMEMQAAASDLRSNHQAACGFANTAESAVDRPPAVAGGFYPREAAEVSRKVDELFASAGAAEPAPWAGALVPHAGWVYSGHLAAAVFARVAFPRQVVVLCPRHRPMGELWSVAPHGRWLFPGGEVPSDLELAARLASRITGLKLDAKAHRAEHAIEVQLPLLAHAAPAARVVGIALGGGSADELLRFGDELADVLQELPELPMLIVSSDLNHFADDSQTRRLDGLALGAIAALDPAGVYEAVRRNDISMCGVGACVAAMQALRRLGRLNRCEPVGYATSADAGGPVNRVVGYAGLLFA